MIIREHREQFCANTFDKLEEMGKFPEKTQYIKRSILGCSRAVGGWRKQAYAGCSEPNQRCWATGLALVWPWGEHGGDHDPDVRADRGERGGSGVVGMKAVLTGMLFTFS